MLLTRAGERIPVALFGSLVLDAQERNLGVIHMVHSVSTTHGVSPEAEGSALRTIAEASLARLLHLSPDAVIILDEAQRILTFNQSAELIFGYRAGEVLGQPLDLLLPPRFVESHRRHIEDFAAAPEASRYMDRRLEISGRRKDGAEFPAAASISKFTEQGQTFFLAILQDITARKQREHTLATMAEEIQLYKDAFGNTAEAMSLTDLEGHILDVNPAFERITGYSRAEALGQKLSLIKSRHSTPEFYREMWKQILSRGYWQGEIINRRKTGEEWDSLLTISTVRDERGQLAAYIGINRDITELKNLQREREALFQAERQQRQLAEALRDTAAALNSTLSVDETMYRILGNLGGVVPHDSANVMLLDAEAQTARIVRRRGYTEGSSDEATMTERLYPLAGMPVLRRMAETRQPVALADVRADPDWVVFPGAAWVRSYLGAPICLKDQVIGFINLNSAMAGHFTSAHVEQLLAFADQTGVAIDRAQLFDDLQRSHLELAEAYDSTLDGWSRALDLRDKETEGHTQRVTEIALRLAHAMGLSETDLVHVRRGALLHDIGKMGVPDHILLKPDKLTDEEWAIMRQHPIYAFEMLLPIAYLRPALDIPYCHHEKWDGSGYPRGLKGEEIPLAARIFAVADVWDALRSDRPYRPAWPEGRVREYIREQAGKHFDPQVVEVFLEMNGEWPTG